MALGTFLTVETHLPTAPHSFFFFFFYINGEGWYDNGAATQVFLPLTFLDSVRLGNQTTPPLSQLNPVSPLTSRAKCAQVINSGDIKNVLVLQLGSGCEGQHNCHK